MFSIGITMIFVYHWKSMEFEITLLTHCYSDDIPMKIPVTLLLVLFHYYSNENTSDFTTGSGNTTKFYH